MMQPKRESFTKEAYLPPSPSTIPLTYTAILPPSEQDRDRSTTKKARRLRKKLKNLAAATKNDFLRISHVYPLPCLSVYDLGMLNSVGKTFLPLLVRMAMILLLVAAAAYAWTFTPSYTLYQIKRALETHDYPTFARYVDVESVADHALDEFMGANMQHSQEQTSKDPLGGIFQRGFLKDLVRDVRPMLKAGLEIAVEQGVRDQSRSLPRIPAVAVIGALWYGFTYRDIASFPVKIKRSEQIIEVKARRTSQWLWRVEEISNLSALLPVAPPVG
jgi:hypothetical protein